MAWPLETPTRCLIIRADILSQLADALARLYYNEGHIRAIAEETVIATIEAYPAMTPSTLACEETARLLEKLRGQDR